MIPQPSRYSRSSVTSFQRETGEDLEQRREGQVLGEAQSGRSSFRLLSLLRDEELIGQARDEATALVAADPDLTGHPALAAAVADLVGDERAEYLEKA